MAELLASLQGLEKLGIVAVLGLGIYFLVREITRLRKEGAGAYRERDAYRLGLERCRGENNLLRQRLGEPIDETDLDDYVAGLLRETS